MAYLTCISAQPEILLPGEQTANCRPLLRHAEAALFSWLPPFSRPPTLARIDIASASRAPAAFPLTR